ncbi:MAG: ATP-binding protein [Dissulfurimicrobium sp.]|uniref:ATP-binding protein n=1 Tax=Dissulfurimicrobium TaxID=1769732 RepID=UPI001EDC3FE4|nr:ATP-binding protein [Dissulfurimicrobium hydrothermale]UKL13110.1 tRNA 2-thiocytidine(32) synthetase TtcA [Dissulfurimicrobium hydrothermale]
MTGKTEKSSYFLRVNRLVGKAIHGYGLLHQGDRIMVALSGGSDSLLTLWFLRNWLKKAPISYEILPVHLDMGFGGGTVETLWRYLSENGLSYHIEETGFGIYAHSPGNRGKSPCFICSMLRRKRLFELAARFGYNKIALGHNLDDMIETFFINLSFIGEMSTHVPRQEMFGGLITIIRPLALVNKGQIERLSRELGLPITKNACPSSGRTRREEIKGLLENFYRLNRHARGNIAKALTRIRPEYLPLLSPLP